MVSELVVSSHNTLNISVEKIHHLNGLSIFIYILLPLAGLTLLWRRKDVFFRLLLKIDRSYVAVYCPSFSKREKLLKWAFRRLPNTWSSQCKTLSGGIADFWRDGSLLCTLINTAVPDACPNPPKHWRKSPNHGQFLAHKYLGVSPMFKNEDFKGDFSAQQERNFIHYLLNIQKAIIKLCSSESCDIKFSSQYIVRGMGISSGEQHRKTIFYVYSNGKSKTKHNLVINIRGPYGTQGTATIPGFHNLNSISVISFLQDQLKRNENLENNQTSFLKTISLDFTSFINPDKDVISNEIPIQIDMEIDRAKVTYIPKDHGVYEINLVSNEEFLQGSPYYINIVPNTSDVQDLFKNSIDLHEVNPKTLRKTVLSKTIDFVDEEIEFYNILDEDQDKIILEKRPLETSVSLLGESGENYQKIDENQDNLSVDLSSLSDNLPLAVIEHSATPEQFPMLYTESLTNVDVNEFLENNKHPIRNYLSTLYESSREVSAEIICDSDNEKADKENVIYSNKTGFNFRVNTDGKTEEKYKPLELVENLKLKSVLVPEESLEIKTDENKKVDFEVANNLQNDIDRKICENIPDDYNNKVKNLENFVHHLNPKAIESTKYIKNIINISNRMEIFCKKQINIDTDKMSKQNTDDQLENNNETPESIKTKSNHLSSKNTSPVCFSHIGPEVESKKYGQRRKILIKQPHVVEYFESENSSLSENENETMLGNRNYLASSEETNLSPSNLCEKSQSLPNIHQENTESNSLEYRFENEFKNVFLERKHFWDSMSSLHSTLSQVSLNSPSKSVDTFDYHHYLNYEGKSKKNISISALNSPHQKLEKRLSADYDLSDDQNILSVNERKLKLFKKICNTTQDDRLLILKPKNNSTTTDNRSKFDTKKYNCQENQKLTKFENNALLATKEVNCGSRFKRAITYFKNLEKHNIFLKNTKSRISSGGNFKRKYSLDSTKQIKEAFSKRSGSLNIQNTNEKLPISRLYFDMVARKVLENDKFSLVKKKEFSNEDDFSFNMLFLNKFKTKKRKNVKSFFQTEL